MSDEKRDTFPDLIRDLRIEDRSLEEDVFNEYADRLEALLAAMEPFLMPVYGQVLAGGAIETDPPPILADMLGDEAPPGSDWVLIDPVSMTDEQRERHEKGRGRSVTGDG